MLLLSHRFRPLDIDDGQPVLAVGDVGIGARDEDALRVGERDRIVRDQPRCFRMGHIDDFEAVGVGDKQIAELQRAGARIVHGKLRHHLRMQRIVE